MAGHIARNPAAAIVRYLELRGGTVTHYDFRAATFDKVNLDLMRATRYPWMASRISAKDAIRIIDRAGSAPWAATRLDAQLKKADPLLVDGPYDEATALWDHFWEQAAP
jgi:hypothetical protein